MLAVVLLVGLAQAGAVAMPAPTGPVDEIIVTARRLPEPLATLPLAVSVVDDAAIGRLAATTLDELSRFVPGFSFHSAAGRGPNSNRPTVRGLTTIQNGIANTSAAASFVDGVYLGGSPQSLPLHDLERIEFLRGPQAAQFGRGTFAGALNYVTRNPGDSLEGGVTVTAAEHGTSRASGWLGGPLLGDRLGILVGAGFDRYDGEYRNTRDGSLVGGEATDDASVKLVARPIDALAINLRLAMQRTDDGHFATWLQPRGENNCCFRTAAAPRAREYYVGRALGSDTVTLYTDALEEAGGAGFELDRDAAALQVALDLPGGHALQSLTGVVSDELERGFDASYAAYDPLPTQPGSFLQRDRLEQSDLSQELRFATRADARWRGVLGGYFYRGRLDEVEKRNVLVAPDGAVTVVDSTVPLVRQDIENRAVFGSVEGDLTPTLTAGLELRYAADEISVAGARRDSATFHSLSPRLTLGWRMNDRLLPYLNVSRGSSPGTFNAVVPDERYRAVDEETVWNYELGLRATLRDGRDRLALAGYFLDVRDQQFTTVVELGGGATTSLLDNVGRTAVHGVELELDSQLTDRLDARLTYAWTDSEIRERLSEELADLRGGNGTSAALLDLGNAAGQKTPRVPRHQASVALEYERALGDTGYWALGGDWSYESSRYAQEDNLIETGSAMLLGAHLRVGWDAWEFSLWGRNLGDDDTPVDVQRYFDRRSGTLPSCASFVTAGTAPPGTVCTGSSTSPRAFAISLPRGRQYGATLRYRF